MNSIRSIATQLSMHPRNDRVLIQRLDDDRRIIALTDRPKSIKGTVLAAGPGKWHEGEWWLVKGEWEWVPGYREPLDVKPGMTVYFNSKWNDLAANYLEDGVRHDFDRMHLHLIQEADIFAIAGA